MGNLISRTNSAPALPNPSIGASTDGTVSATDASTNPASAARVPQGESARDTQRAFPGAAAQRERLLAQVSRQASQHEKSPQARGSASSSGDEAHPEESVRYQLGAMPRDVLDKIASQLRGEDTMAMALAHPRALGGAIRSHVGRAIITDQASQVSTLVDFQTTLTRIGNVRPEHQAEPLFEMGMRVHALPANDRPQAVAAFRAAASALPDDNKTPELDALLRVANYAKPEAAVQSGENVGIVYGFHGAVGPRMRIVLERMALNGPASRAVLGGENVRAVAERHGIVEDEFIVKLNQLSAGGPAGDRVGAGENVRDVAHQFGIDRMGVIESLEMRAATGPARRAVLGGENVQEVAQRHGILGEVARAMLHMATSENAQEVAQRHGNAGATALMMLETRSRRL